MSAESSIRQYLQRCKGIRLGLSILRTHNYHMPIAVLRIIMVNSTTELSVQFSRYLLCQSLC